MPYFTVKELKCKCGCNTWNTTDAFLGKLNKAREVASIPFKVNRCCSCVEHNLNVGGSDTSSHLKGIAIDISSMNSHQRFKILEGAILAGFTRIGLGKTFIHLDDDLSKDQEVVWLY